MKVPRRSDKLPAASRHAPRGPDFLVASAGIFFLVLIPHSSFAICDNSSGAPKESLTGTFQFNGADLNYESAVLETSKQDVLTFRYCIQNTHSHTLAYVQWGPAGDWHFDNSVAPRDAKPNQYDSLKKSTNTKEDFKYGEHKGQWQQSQPRDTLIELSGHRNLDNLILVQSVSSSLNEAMQDPATITLNASTIFTMPATTTVRNEVLRGDYHVYSEKDFLDLAVSVTSELGLLGGNPAITQRAWFRTIDYQDLDLENIDFQYKIRLEGRSSSAFAGISPEVLDDGVHLELAPHSEWIKIFEADPLVLEFAMREARERLEIVDESGDAFGSLGFNVFLPEH